LTLAQQLAHPYSLSLAMGWAACFHQFLREGRVAQDRAEAAIILTKEQDFRSGRRLVLLCAAGCWRSKDKRRKGSRRSIKA
jgi:hypothetical protein